MTIIQFPFRMSDLGLLALIEDRAGWIGEYWPVGPNACLASTAGEGMAGDRSLDPLRGSVGVTFVDAGR